MSGSGGLPLDLESRTSNENAVSDTTIEIPHATVRSCCRSGWLPAHSATSSNDNKSHPNGVLRYIDGHRQQNPSSMMNASGEPDDVHDENESVAASDYETASARSISATSSVFDHTIEHGRRYQNFRNGIYPIPNDEEELNREDMKHAMVLELCDGSLFYAPISENVTKILDVGTGTGKCLDGKLANIFQPERERVEGGNKGISQAVCDVELTVLWHAVGIWAIEVGERLPDAHVRGIDLSPTQPPWVPSNVDFLVDDCEDGEWLDRDVDFVHLRFMTVVLRDVPRVLSNAFK